MAARSQEACGIEGGEAPVPRHLAAVVSAVVVEVCDSIKPHHVDPVRNQTRSPAGHGSLRSSEGS